MQFLPKAVKSEYSHKSHPIRNFLAAAVIAGGIMLGVSGCGTSYALIFSTKTDKYVDIASSIQEKKPFDSLSEDRILSEKDTLRCEIRGRQ